MTDEIMAAVAAATVHVNFAKRIVPLLRVVRFVVEAMAGIVFVGSQAAVFAACGRYMGW